MATIAVLNFLLTGEKRCARFLISPITDYSQVIDPKQTQFTPTHNVQPWLAYVTGHK